MAESWGRWMPVGRKSVSRDVDDELRFHIEERTRDLIAEGRTPEEARREAERRFGEVGAIREHLVADDTRRDERNRIKRWLSRSEEHTSELQSLRHLVCRLLL